MNTPRTSIIATLLMFAFSLFLFVGCTSAPVPVTQKQQVAAKAVNGFVSVALVPVLVKNPAYIAAAGALADAVGAVTGDQFTTGDTDNVILAVERKGYTFTVDDEKAIRATINAAWDQYAKDWQAMVGAQVRPDVQLFVNAVADGVHVAATRASAAK